MDSGVLLLCLGSAGVALIHTLVGPDHYLPFVAMARARGWTARRTTWVTLGCGTGHIAGSLVLGLAAAFGGIELQRLAQIESARGSVATWALIAFGAVYFAWGLRHAARGAAHTHRHAHSGSLAHEHVHDHRGAHLHGPDETTGQTRGRPARTITPWVLFAIFVFGPCEPMIPLVMYPAASGNWVGVALVATVFGVVTLLTMLAAVLLALYGVRRIRLGAAERYTHALAGLTLLLTGGAMAAFGL